MARGGDDGTAAGAEGAAEGAAAVETGSRAAAEAPLERLLQEEVRSLLPGADELRERAELSRQLEAVIKAGWEGGQLDLASLGWRAAQPPSLVLFGSSASNLHSTGADLDMTLLIDLPHPAQCSVVRQLERTYPYPYPYPYP